MGTLPISELAKRVAIATKAGLDNAEDIARASIAAGVPFHLAAAIAEGESHGRNVYGHDLGGVFSTATGPVTIGDVTYPKGSSIPVTPANAALFLYLVGSGKVSNGIGPFQLTYRGHFPIMLGQGLLPWVPYDNAYYALQVFAKYLENASGSINTAGAHYNGGGKPGLRAVQYGANLLARDTAWRKRFGL